MSDLVDKLQLGELLGADATFEATGGGYLFERAGRRYRLTGTGTLGTLEGWIPRYHASPGDLALGQFRADFTRALARDDAALLEEVSRDLFKLWSCIRFVIAEHQHFEALAMHFAHAEALEAAAAPAEAGEEERDVLIKGLSLDALAIVADIAADDGATVLVREVEMNK